VVPPEVLVAVVALAASSVSESSPPKHAAPRSPNPMAEIDLSVLFIVINLCPKSLI
jgi:hypothetical protein